MIAAVDSPLDDLNGTKRKKNGPKPIADLAFQNKREVYNLLMRASADTVIKIAGDPKHLGARVGITSVLHTWGSAMTHHPHVIARQASASQSAERGT